MEQEQEEQGAALLPVVEDLNWVVNGGADAYRDFVRRLKERGSNGVVTHPATGEETMTIRESADDVHFVASIDLEVDGRRRVLHLAFKMGNMYLVGFKNHVDGPWMELTLKDEKDVGVIPQSYHLKSVHGDYGSLIRHDFSSVTFNSLTIENAILHVATWRLVPNRIERFTGKKQIATLIMMLAEGARFPHVVNEVANAWQSFDPVPLTDITELFTSWTTISRQLLKAIENPANFRFRTRIGLDGFNYYWERVGLLKY